MSETRKLVNSAVYYCMLVSWALLPHILYATYVLLHMYAMGTAASYIVYCVLLHMYAMGTAASYIVYCVLLHMYTMGTAASYFVCCVLPHVLYHG